MRPSTSNRKPWWGGWTGQRRHEPGFRLNGVDLILGFAALAATVGLHQSGIPMWWMPLYAFLSFFGFCNLLRITRGYELIWCAVVIATTFLAIALIPANPAALILPVGILSQLSVAGFAFRAGRLRGVLRKP